MTAEQQADSSDPAPGTDPDPQQPAPVDDPESDPSTAQPIVAPFHKDAMPTQGPDDGAQL